MICSVCNNYIQMPHPSEDSGVCFDCLETIEAADQSNSTEVYQAEEIEMLP
jgi:hypothetical protein